MQSLLKKYYMDYIAGFWDQRFAIVALGVLSALYFGLIGVAWAVTGEFTRWGGHLLQFLGLDTNSYGYLKLIKFAGTPLTRVDGVMVLGMFAGAFISALLGQNVKLRIPSGKRFIQALVGGIIAGFGTRMAMGCNLAALFTGIPQFSIHTWLFTLGTIGGTYIGLKISMLPWMMGSPKLSSAKDVKIENMDSVMYRWQPLLGIAAFLMLVVYLQQKAVGGLPLNLFLAIVFGFAFGFLIQKGQVCFTSAFRDLWLVGRANTAKALLLGIAVATIITAVFLGKGAAPNVIWWAGPGALLGGFLFGVGIVIAGGCETGWMYRAMEGQVQFWIVGLGNVIGATILTLAWDSMIFPYLAEPFPRVDLVRTYGLSAAIIMTGIMLFTLYFWADWRQSLKNSFLARRSASAGK